MEQLKSIRKYLKNEAMKIIFKKKKKENYFIKEIWNKNNEKKCKNVKEFVWYFFSFPRKNTNMYIFYFNLKYFPLFRSQ